jgi:hypothetical protein
LKQYKKFQRLKKVKYAAKNILEKLETFHKLKKRINKWAYATMILKKVSII